MPYASTADLPLRVRSHIPPHAQKIFRAVFNSVLEETGDEERAFKSAWSQVHKHYNSPGDNMWHKDKPFKYEEKEKSETDMSDEEMVMQDIDYSDLDLPDGDDLEDDDGVIEKSKYPDLHAKIKPSGKQTPIKARITDDERKEYADLHANLGNDWKKHLAERDGIKKKFGVEENWIGREGKYSNHPEVIQHKENTLGVS